MDILDLRIRATDYLLPQCKSDTVAYQYIGFYIQCIIVIILELQFTFTTLTVLARFTALNDALAQTAIEAGVSVDEPSVRTHTNLFEVSNKIPVLERRKNLNMKVDSPTNLLDPAVIVRHHSSTTRLAVAPHVAIRQLTMLHGALCDVVDQLGASYSLPLIVILLSMLLHLIVTPYYLLVDLVSLQPRPAFAAAQSLWCINHIFRLLLIIEPCYLTKTQFDRSSNHGVMRFRVNVFRKPLLFGKASLHMAVLKAVRTAKLLSQLTTNVQDKQLATQVEIFNRQFVLRCMCYSPMGICVLDRPLIASV
ncbi:Gustatory receptor for sugar taste 43a [Eumeta japonica]|uniref:Gustatory receptor n=1 Tax=Eumeta variegata TaxID=151549 RepID=A0A4C1WVG2_EUMVA|nr:Gustatory receptor for sugar taste 43a [Eumeta japonica]